MDSCPSLSSWGLESVAVVVVEATVEVVGW